ncbi:hypothetical protein LTR10_000582 [Elasticomyces elasticus]|nr:hypothetical protein LTR10_000582 [Elasticomyces elasticus]KAK4980170.1 hypothetical protein LTR42_000477 [Elasticomyces elasticus]
MLAIALGALLLRLAQALPLNSPLLHEYDYIVVGGGVAGLTVASRLSHNPDVTVLLLEAGPADNHELFVEVPGMIGDGIGSIYDWNLSTVPQTALDGAPRSIPQGFGLGGSSLINGMLWNRGSIGDYDDFVSLGNPGWSWEDMMPYFQRSESYHPVASLELAMNFSIEANMSVHGTSGPVNVSFAHWFWGTSAVLFDALNELGVPTAYDPNMGQIAGASFLPLSLDPVTATRSTARRAYYDPVADRPNLWVSTGQHATQIFFQGMDANDNATVMTSQDNPLGQGISSAPDIPGIFGGTSTLDVSQSGQPPTRLISRTLGGLLRWFRRAIRRGLSPRQTNGAEPMVPARLRAVGVEYAANSRRPRQTVNASREVIIAAGAFHSPQLLMLSGIGPADVLQENNIPLNMDLPGVGSNLHDHGQVWTWYPYNNSAFSTPLEFINDPAFAEDAWTDYWQNRTGPLTSGAFDGVAFPVLAAITNGSTVIPDTASSQTASQYLANGTHSSILLGYARQLELLTTALADPTRASYEIVNSNTGALTVANMRPLSRGSVTINSSLPFDSPVIDPRYSSNPIDAQVLLAAIRFNERLIATESLSQLHPIHMYPPPHATDAEVLQWINTHMQTEYHPVGTCAMMPYQLGGVVSPELLVYGTSNLRVVDSSIIPILPAAHLQAVVYGIAEKAADIIKAASPRPPIPTSFSFSYDPLPATSSASPTATENGEAAVVTHFVTVVATQTVYI